mmetsp:Transcript_25221/g.64073  ORF Transcript_25221/g.64073 Transcript_25221/m.64073 type:complete len:219 (+) Transcript_25221:785-1441(+)
MAGLVPPVAAWFAADAASGVEGCGVAPVLHPAKHRVDLVVHRAIRVRFVHASRRREGRHGPCDVGEGRIVRRARSALAVVVERAPRVADGGHPAVESHHNLEEVPAEELVDGAAGDGGHALVGPLDVAEIAVGEEPHLEALKALVADRVGHWHDPDTRRVHQPRDPRVRFVRGGEELRELDRAHLPDALVAMQAAEEEDLGALWVGERAPVRDLYDVI